MTHKFMQKVQRLGGAMFTPVLLFAIFGIVVGFATLFKNPLVMGPIANSNTTWFKMWTIIYNGGNTVFSQMPLLFVIGLPIALAKKQSGRACMEAFVIYLIFVNFVGGILNFWGLSFGIDFASTARTSGLATIAGIRTLDMGMAGAILISGIAVFLHNKFFDMELPKMIETFKGSPLVTLIGFFVMIPVALLVCLIWPNIQHGIFALQDFLISSKVIGVWIYTFLERLLIPLGLHHFVYAPFLYDAAVVNEGIKAYWVANLSNFSTTTQSLRDMFPQGGYALTGMSKMFAPLGIGAAFYVTAKTEKKKKVLALLIPVVITAVFTGITEPLEFTFLFIAPVLFFVHAVLAATLATVTYAAGIVGDFSLGLIQNAALNWIPLFKFHAGSYLLQILIGLVFSLIYFIVFRFLILKFDFKTPGREELDESKLYSKEDYTNKKNDKASNESKYADQAVAFLDGLGGKENIVDVTNCATRLRVSVKDSSKIKKIDYFKSYGAHGLVVNKNGIQVVVGLSVPTVREEFEKLI